MKTLLRLLFLVVSLCCRLSQAAAESSRDLAYTFDLHDLTHIRVTLTLTPPRSGSEFLVLPSQWAGETELYRAITDLHATSPGATLLPTANPARWLLETRHPGPVAIAYTLTQDWSGPLVRPREHRAILGPTLFEFTGENALLAPVIAGGAAVHASIDFTGLPATQALVTSFGTRSHQRFTGTWSELRNALFTGGEMTTRTFSVEGQPVLLAMHGAWTFQPDEIVPTIRGILVTERHLWNDTAIPFYAIVMAPYENTASGGGGSSFTNVFNLFLAEKQAFNADTASLIAHESFHHWNPGSLGAVENTGEIAWFGEGFTSFYQDAVLERAGIVDHAEYLTRLNTAIRDYRLSPGIHATNADLQRLPSPDLFASPDAQQPYLRGAMIALWLDAEIRRQTSGRRALMDLMLDLRRDRSEPLTSERIFRTATRFVDEPTVGRLRAFALDGLQVPVPPSVLGQCIAFPDRPAWTFNLGFDPASLRADGVVQGVEPDSSAWHAGVRNGQQIGGFSLWNGNAEREVTLTLRDPDGKRERLIYLPHGRLLSIPQAEELPNCRPELRTQN